MIWATPMVTELSRAEFRRNQIAAWQSRHPEKLRAAAAKYRASNPERMLEIYRRHDLKSKYGMTIAEYDALLASQGGACAICRQPERRPRNNRTGEPPRRLAVDHDHASGSVRGLLCADCNRAIGLMNDNPETLRAASDYLKKVRQWL
jgi:hypothetical protein